jgi:hypothetical protein
MRYFFRVKRGRNRHHHGCDRERRRTGTTSCPSIQEKEFATGVTREKAKTKRRDSSRKNRSEVKNRKTFDVQAPHP